MNEEPKVDYSDVQEDFEFFLDHTNETEAQIAAMKPHLSCLLERRSLARMLDFGCGNGDFASRLLRALDPQPTDLDVFLLEPVADLLQQAATGLSQISERIEESVPDLQSLEGKGFDLILANHSLYYVSKTGTEVCELVRRLAPAGIMIAALQHRENALAQIWLKTCQLTGEEFPFLFADNIEVVLGSHDIPYDREMISYKIEFPDSADARYRILHFLFGPYLSRIPKQQALALFDPYRHSDKIRIETEYPHLIMRGTRAS